MRVRLPLGRTLFFTGLFLFLVVALLPLRLAIEWTGLNDRGLAARETQGSLWLGTLAEAQMGSVLLGTLQARVRALPLFIGRASIDFSRDDAASPLRGTATVSRSGIALDDMTADLNVEALLRPLPIASVHLEDVSVRFADSLCKSAQGRVQAEAVGEVAGMALPGGLSGTARCERGALLLPLASRSGTETINLRLFVDGRYEAELTIQPSGAGMAERLLAAGFVAGQGGTYSLRAAGEL